MKFGDNLRKLRKSKKLSQEELAFKMKVSRQSVSKWETSEAYPEMNHILELCKIFHCRVNDLVNDSIVDADSLDEEVKMNVVKFKKEQQDKMKGLSKAISVIAKIGKILVTVCIPIIIATMIIVGVLICKVDVVDNEIRFDHQDIIKIVESNNRVSIKIGDEIVADTKDENEIIKVKEVLENNSKVAVIGYVETGFCLLIVCLVLVRMMLKHLERLFDNMNQGDTPFTLENVNHIKRMAYLMIALTILPNIIGVIFELLFNMDLDIGFELFSLIEILFLFSVAYVFQYGYEIQLDSKGKMYGDANE